MKRQLVVAVSIVCLLLQSCTYVRYSMIQAEYARIQNASPNQLNIKHMLDRETYFVFGRTVDGAVRYSDVDLAIAAYSSRFRENECVDVMYFAGAGRHFGLNLPEGRYRLVVFADLDRDGTFSPDEVVGQRQVAVDRHTSPQKVLAHVDVTLASATPLAGIEPLALPRRPELEESLFFPLGTIRGLDDPLFDEEMAVMGMYDPASFLERAPTMFYALEEDLGYKIPVVFVHGIGGSARNFQPLVERLDRRRYKPWFFHYPSGGDLDQLAHFFYTLFLSGEVIPLYGMPMIIVAHSMGGLIVREALNKCDGGRSENKVELLVTIATPWGGHPAAASGEKHGLIVLPAWRDVNPQSRFLAGLYRKPLPEAVKHLLLYAYHNPETFKIGANSDGVVPLSSQLHHMAQKESREQFGFDEDHTAILDNRDMIDLIGERMAQVDNIFPPDHLEVLYSGGYDLDLPQGYGPLTRYLVRTVGRYLMAVGNGTLAPAFPEQQRFVRVVKGEAQPVGDVERQWLQFLRDFPELAAADDAGVPPSGGK